MANNGKIIEEFTLPNGCTCYVRKTAAGGREYVSDEVGGGGLGYLAGRATGLDKGLTTGVGVLGGGTLGAYLGANPKFRKALSSLFFKRTLTKLALSQEL